jgi:hypothetical protein
MGSIASFPPSGSTIDFSLNLGLGITLGKGDEPRFSRSGDRLAEYYRPGETIIGRVRLQLPKMVVKLKPGK